MAKTVLNLAKAFCYEDNLPAPSSLVGSTDPASLQLLYLIEALGRETLRKHDWIQLKRTHTITTVDGTSEYSLPSDFKCPIPETFWDQSFSRQVLGNINDTDWNNLVYGFAVDPVSTFYFRVFGRLGTTQIKLIPTPDSTTPTLSFDYISNAWIKNGSNWVDAIAADTDTTAFDDDLMIQGLRWMWKKAKKMDYEADYSLWEAKLETIKMDFEFPQVVSINGNADTPKMIDVSNYPEGGF